MDEMFTFAKKMIKSWKFISKHKISKMFDGIQKKQLILNSQKLLKSNSCSKSILACHIKLQRESVKPDMNI